MIDKLLEAILKNRLLVLVFTLGLLGAGVWSFRTTPIDSFPDATPTMVRIFTVSPGLSPVDVETLVSYPIEISMYGIPNLRRVQSTSAFGLSRVNVYFEDGTDYYFARRLVMERLAQAREQIPAGLGEPKLGPMSTGLSRIFMYEIRSEEGHEVSLLERRTAQDWIVKPMLRTIPGVTEVLSVGGFERQFQVRLDAQALVSRDLSTGEVVEALRRNNRNVGASFVERAGEEYIVRGYGWIDPGEEGLEDIEDVIIREHGGTPIYVRDVAEVTYGGAIRRGALLSNGEETVGGFVLKLYGENTREVLDDIDERLAKINRALPEGMKIVPFYSQGKLVGKAIGTVGSALLIGALIVLFVLYLFLGNLRSTLVLMLAMPFCALMAFIAMKQVGLSANLMSLGGLAIAIGIMGDGATVMLENAMRHIEERREERRLTMQRLVLEAGREVARPVVFAVGIIAIVFLPLFSLQGVEYKLFSPMAFTVCFALAGAILYALVVVPVVTSLLFSRRSSQKEPLVAGWLRRAYRPLVTRAVRRRGWVLAAAGLALAGSLSVFPLLGSEFVPTLREGSLQVRSVLPAGASLPTAIQYGRRIEEALRGFPEVESVYARVGRAEVGGDPEPVNVVAFMVELKPLGAWESGRDYEAFQSAVARRLEQAVPGLANNVSQPIQLRTDELLSGVRAEVVISVFGDDLETLDRLGEEVKEIAASVRGSADVRKQQQGGKKQIVVRPDRQKLARLGISTDEVLSAVETGVGGTVAGTVFEGVRRFPIFVRLQEDQRAQIASIRDLPLRTAEGKLVPLSQVAALEVYEGPKLISRNEASRRIYVQLNVRGRDMGSVVNEIRRKVDEQVELPAGYFVDYGGQFENQERAMKRLYLVVPITLALILLLLFSALRRLRHAALVFLNVPLAVIGGIFALFLSGLYLSVPAAVGFIAVFGIAVLNGLVLVDYIGQLRLHGAEMDDAVVTAAERRLRPVLMTALTTIGGLVPLLLTDDIGSNVQRPLAAVVVGGLVTSTLLTLVVLPAAYRLLGGEVGAVRTDTPEE